MTQPTSDSDEAIASRQGQIIALLKELLGFLHWWRGVAVGVLIVFMVLGAFAVQLYLHNEDTRRTTQRMDRVITAVLCQSYARNELEPPKELDCG